MSLQLYCFWLDKSCRLLLLLTEDICNTTSNDYVKDHDRLDKSHLQSQSERKLCKVTGSWESVCSWNSRLWKTWEVVFTADVRHKVVQGHRLRSRRDSLLLRATTTTAFSVTVRVGKCDGDLNDRFLTSARLFVLDTNNNQARAMIDSMVFTES